MPEVRILSSWVPEFREIEVVKKRVQAGWMESVEKNDGNTMQHEGTNKDQRYYLKEGCGAGDDVRTGVSSDDKETGRQLEVPEMRMLRFSQGVTTKEKIRNEHIRGTLKVDRFGQKVRESGPRWYSRVKHRDEDCVGRKVLVMRSCQEREDREDQIQYTRNFI